MDDAFKQINDDLEKLKYELELERSRTPTLVVASILSEVTPGKSWSEYHEHADRLLNAARAALTDSFEHQEEAGFIRWAIQQNPDGTHPYHPRRRKEPPPPHVHPFIREVIKGESFAQGVERFLKWESASWHFSDEWFKKPHLRQILVNAYNIFWEKHLREIRSQAGKRGGRRKNKS